MPRSTPPTRCASRCAPASWRRCDRSWGSMVVRVRTGADVPSGMVFAPIHWNRAFASDARVGALDQSGGRSDFRRAGAQAHAGRHRALRGRVVWRDAHAQPLPAAGHAAGGRRCRARSSCATSSPANHSRDWSIEARRLLGVPADASLADVDWIEYRDPARRVYRAAWFVDDRLQGCIYFDRRPALPERAWLARLFTRPKLRCRRARQPARRPRSSKAPTRVRWCVRVSAWGAIPSPPARASSAPPPRPSEIGKRLKCGTNCGSCVPEIQAIIGEGREEVAPERYLVVFAASPRGDIVRLPVLVATLVFSHGCSAPRHPEKLLLWPDGAPGAMAGGGEETVTISEQGDHVVSNVHRPSITVYLPTEAHRRVRHRGAGRRPSRAVDGSRGPQRSRASSTNTASRRSCSSTAWRARPIPHTPSRAMRSTI